MTDAYDEMVREMAFAALTRQASAIAAAGLRATVDVPRWSSPAGANVEVRISFWRGDAFIDVAEDLVMTAGQATAPDDLRKWLDEMVVAIVSENAV